jgi:hypothetical protein
MFIVSFAVAMLRAPFFRSLAAAGAVHPRTADRAGKAWFWATLALGAVFAAAVYLPVMQNVHAHTYSKDPWTQSSPSSISIWAVACGLFTLAVLALFYAVYMRKRGITLKERGIAMPWGQAAKTVLLAVTVVGAAYFCAFLADYFFKADFRLWVLAVKAFPPDVIWVSLFPAMAFLLVFYVVASLAANSINFIKLTGRPREREWVNTAVLAAFNVAPAVFLLAVQYLTFFITGEMAWPDAKMTVLWLFPLLVFLPVTTVVSRKIYRATGNPYLGGLINGSVITLIACSNTLTWA